MRKLICSFLNGPQIFNSGSLGHFFVGIVDVYRTTNCILMKFRYNVNWSRIFPSKYHKKAAHGWSRKWPQDNPQERQVLCYEPRLSVWRKTRRHLCRLLRLWMNCRIGFWYTVVCIFDDTKMTVACCLWGLCYSELKYRERYNDWQTCLRDTDTQFVPTFLPLSQIKLM